jgi:hypothetical protein
MKKIPEAVMDMIDEERVVCVGTASHRGAPHLIFEKGLRLLDEQHVSFTGWFCLRGIANLGECPKIAIAVTDDGGEGYQLLGDIVEMKRANPAQVDLPTAKTGEDLPDFPRTLFIKIESVLPFRTGAHGDQELMR